MPPDTKQSGDNEEIVSLSRNEPVHVLPRWTGKDGKKWLNHKPKIPPTKIRGQNIISKLPGVKDDFIEEIVNYTIKKLDLLRPSYQRPKDCRPTDFEELLAFIGLLYIAGIKKDKHLNTKELWATDGTAPDYFLTLVGTLRENKPQIPPRLLEVRDRPVESSMFAFGIQPNHCMLASFVPKKNKNVLMISTLPDNDYIDPTSIQNKPDIITYYNLMKGGVDVVDRMKSEYSVSQVSNHWPFTIFNSMLNIGTINSQIIYKSNTDVFLTRRSFISILSKQLIGPYLLRRATITSLSFNLREEINSIIKNGPKEKYHEKIQNLQSLKILERGQDVVFVQLEKTDLPNIGATHARFQYARNTQPEQLLFVIDVQTIQAKLMNNFV
ncbi:hypothetical protein NQ314_012827 [Rhamnusium bicolor]|uniref:PiggyBac transposable element-derived protein domain-containing protein n=1 Tax=Rhamnusium bicolor TaxID=1586634 RepID=A0AAV8X9D4_9CUCU|nr:hypothetical protein NQ314_012827 [Rhamnusium bicolor]